MARFYGEMSSQTSSTRAMCAKSAISAHIRGWNIGCQVDVYVDKDGRDKVEVWITGGSNSPKGTLLASFAEDELKVYQEEQE